MDFSVLTQHQLDAIKPFIEQARELERLGKLKDEWRVRLGAFTTPQWREIAEAFK